MSTYGKHLASFWVEDRLLQTRLVWVYGRENTGECVFSALNDPSIFEPFVLIDGRVSVTDRSSMSRSQKYVQDSSQRPRREN